MIDREHVRFLINAAWALAERGSDFSWHWNDGAGMSHRSVMAGGDFDRAAKIGQELWDENKRSIHARYPDTAEGGDMPGPIGETYQYRVHRSDYGGKFCPYQVVASCDCYRYQTCEHSGHEGTMAWGFVDELRRVALSAILARGPSTTWGAPDPARSLDAIEAGTGREIISLSDFSRGVRQ